MSNIRRLADSGQNGSDLIALLSLHDLLSIALERNDMPMDSMNMILQSFGLLDKEGKMNETTQDVVLHSMCFEGAIVKLNNEYITKILGDD